MITNLPKESAGQRANERLEELCRALTKMIDELNYELGVIEDRLDALESTVAKSK